VTRRLTVLLTLVVLHASLTWSQREDG